MFREPRLRRSSSREGHARATSEPPIVAYQTLASALPIEEEQALARRLIEPLAAKVLERGDDEQKYAGPERRGRHRPALHDGVAR